MRRLAGLERGSLILSAASLLAACRGQGTTPGEGALGTSTDALQLSYINQNYVNLVTSANGKTQATGAIRFTWTDGTRGPCGSTFISPHYAVTAAHCVPKDQLTVNSTTFTVTQYDTTGLTATAVANQAAVDGLWPNYNHHTTLSASDGYNVTTYNDCVVTTRCSTNPGDPNSQFGRDNCPFTTDVDIAVIKCPTRPAGATYAAVATSDSGTQNVEAWWFHEVVNMRTSPNEAIGPSDGWTHYGNFDASTVDAAAALRQINWHYKRASNNKDHQLIPLFSGTWPDGTPYKAMGNDQTLTLTNMPICHGTSGSGIFPRGDSAYLGPADLGSTNSRICADMVAANGARTIPRMDYIQASWTRQLEAMSVITNDRPH